MKLLAVKVQHCRECPQFHKAAHYCNLRIEELGPIEMFEVNRDGGIHPDCPLPNYEKLEAHHGK